MTIQFERLSDGIIWVHDGKTDLMTLDATNGIVTIGANIFKVGTASVPSTINSIIAGLAGGYKLARSATPAAVTGTLDVVTGLATIVACFADAESDFDGDSLAAVQAVNTGGAGHILLKAWKVTTGGVAGNPTMIAATVAKNISWLAIGT